MAPAPASAAARPPTAAAGAAPILVLEVHAGERPADADGYLAPLRDELERRGFAARPETLGRLLAGRLPRPGLLDPGLTAGGVSRLVDEGYDAFTGARFGEAVRKLGRAIALIDRNPALLVLDMGHLLVVHKAYVGLALAQARLGRSDEAAATLAELIRLVRTRPVTRAEHGPAAEQLSHAVYRQVMARGRGRLAIRTGSSRAMIFVDRQLRGLGEATLEDLIPGVYRVLVQEPGAPGLAYEIEVPEHGDVELEAAWAADRALVASPRWYGFALASDADRHEEPAWAAAAARRWSERDRIAVVATAMLEGERVLIGTLYLTTGEVLRGAVLALDGVTTAELAALATFLAEGTPAPGLRVLRLGVTPGAIVAALAQPRPRRLAPRLLVGAGATALAAGAILFALDEDPHREGPQAPRYLDTATPAAALGLAGAAALGAGVWWWARGDPPASAPFFLAGRGGATIGWAGRF